MGLRVRDKVAVMTERIRRQGGDHAALRRSRKVEADGG
jgi:hypothetical protein